VWRNTDNSYGLLAVVLHWLVAVAVLSLFALGLWMVDLTLYDPWYNRAPDIHKSVGVLLFAVVALRLVWRLANPRPRPAPGISPVEARMAVLAHAALYGLMFAVMITGYLIPTANGRPVEVFGLFSVPATITGIEDQENVAGDIHLDLAIALVALTAVHTLAALKHHFIDRDQTLTRMLGRKPKTDSRNDT
jgi:cytochrome b561